MVEATAADRVLLALADADWTGSESAAGRTVVRLSDALKASAESMADRVALLSTLSELEDEGLVESHATADQRTYTPTDRGRERAAEVRDRLADRVITAVDGHDEETVPLGEVDRYLPEPALPRALARLTDDGILYLEATVGEEFVDRETGLARLDDHLERTRTEGGRAVLVAGEPGIGKTTLVEECLARRETLATLEGVCRRDVPEPYHAVRAAIEPHLADSPFDRPEIDPEDAEALSDMRTALFADVADAVLDLAADGPVVLFLDDLHLAAEPTLELLDFLVDRLPEGPVLLAATYRPDDPAVDRLTDLEADWAAAGPHERIALAPFERADTRGLVEWLVGTRRVPGTFVDLVHERTGGVPLFVAETVTHLLDRGEIDPTRGIYPDAPGEIALSGAVEEAIDRRLAPLDDTALEIARTAALLGGAFDEAALERAVEIPDPDLREYVAVLVDAGLLERAGPDRLRFESGLVRETVAGGIPEDRRAVTHERIAAALEALAGDDPERAGAVAGHLERAGERERALEAWLDAADHAETVYAQELALEAYRHALDLAREVGDDRRVLDTLEGMGEVQALVGEHDAATRTLEYLLTEADDPQRKQRAARKLAAQQRAWGEYDDAIETADRGLAAGESDTPEACRLLLTKASALIESGQQPDTQAALLDEALALARDLDDPELRGLALRGQVGRVWRQTPGATDDETITRMEEAIDLLEEAGDETTRTRSLTNLGAVYHFSGQIRDAKPYQAEALERFREMGHRKSALTANQNLACILMELHTYRDGDRERAMEQFEEVIEEAKALNDDPILAMATMNTVHLLWKGYHRGEAALERAHTALERAQAIDAARIELWSSNFLARLTLYVADDPDGAREHAERQVEIGRRAGRGMDTAVGLIHTGAIHRERGDLPAALEAHREALDVATENDLPAQELDARAELVRVHLARDDVETARRHVRRLEDRLDDGILDVPADLQSPVQTGVRRPMLAAHGARPRLARAEGEYDRAIRGFEFARAAAVAVDNRRYELEYGHELGTTLVEAGNRERARRVLADARERAADADLHRFRRKCERALDGLAGDGSVVDRDGAAGDR